jgi:predicted secreted protein
MNLTISVWWIAIFVVLILGVIGWMKSADLYSPGGDYNFSGAFVGLARVFVSMAVVIGLLAIFAIKGCVGW